MRRVPCPGLRVLYVSGYTGDAVMHQAGVSPDMAFLQKPYTAIGLMSKIRETLDDASNKR